MTLSTEAPMGHHPEHIHSVRLFNTQAELQRAQTDIDSWRQAFTLERSARERAESECAELRRAVDGIAGEGFVEFVLRLQRERDAAVEGNERAA